LNAIILKLTSHHQPPEAVVERDPYNVVLNRKLLYMIYPGYHKAIF
jgi:hypothetical protein